MAASVLAVNLASPSSTISSLRHAMASRSFIRRTQAVLYWTPISRESWSAALPFTEFAENQMAMSIFLKLSLRAWNTVPERH
ncbi:hypothetical protein [Rhizobium grahamii]|uniref:hypothetical protein n=1 Tax=Rhizobium grahamii TaxID=1120045 RepID=UPI00114683C9|nr:hypothetical protein [Rhizobium grahamii]